MSCVEPKLSFGSNRWECLNRMLTQIWCLQLKFDLLCLLDHSSLTVCFSFSMCACGCLCMFAFKCCFLWCFFKWVITIFLAEECEVAKGARLGMIMSLPSRKLSNTPRNFSHLEAKATSFTWCVSCSILFYYSFFFLLSIE